MKLRWSLGGLVYFLVAPGTAEAQLPPLPQIGESAPEVRLATDLLADRVETFSRRISKLAATRREEHERARRRLRELRQYDEGLEGGSAVEPSRDFDPMLADRILATIESEEKLLAEAVELSQRAVAHVRRGPATRDAANFDEVISLMLTADRLEAEAAAAQAVAQRLHSLAALGVESEPGGTLSERLLAYEWRLQEARLEHAMAVALELQARSRTAREQADQAREALSVSAADSAAAEADLTRVQKEVQEAKQGLLDQRKGLRPGGARRLAAASQEMRDAERALVLSRLDLLDWRREALEGRVAKAQARALAIGMLAEGKVVAWPRDLSAARIFARLATIAQERTSLETLKERLRDEEEKLPSSSALRAAVKSRRDVLDDTLGVLRDMRQSFETIQTMHRATVPLSAGPGGMPLPYAVALTALVVLLGLLLLTYGLKVIHRLVHTETGRLKLDRKLAVRVDTAISLLWPVLVVSSCGALLVWPIWGVDLTVLEALKAIDHPLFYVDDAPVSILSILELLFAPWAALVLSRAIRDFLNRRVYKALGWDIGLTNALNTLVHYVVLLIGIIVGVRFLGIGASSFALLFGILGIGVGFGLRNITENFLSGLIVLAERPVRIGDFVEIDGNVEGVVESIRVRSTTVVTRDNVALIIPNSEFVGQRVTNWSHADPKVRIPIPVRVTYGSDTDLVRRTLLDVAKKHGQVLKKPQPEVHLRSFGPSGLEFLLLVWIDDQQQRFRIASDLHFAVDRAFRRIGLKMALPQLDVHLDSLSIEQTAGPSPVRATIEVEAGTLDLPERPDGESQDVAPLDRLSGLSSSQKPS